MKLSNKILLGLFAAIALNLLTGMVIMRSGLGPNGIGNGATYLEGKGPNKKIRLTVGDFSELEIDGTYEVHLIQGEEYVEIEAQENIVDLFQVATRRNNVLTVDAKEGYTLQPTSKIVLTIGFKNLTAIRSYSSTKFFSQKTLNFDKLRLHFGGATYLETPMAAKELECQINGASNLKLDGITDYLKVTISDSGQFFGESLVAKNAKARVNGAGFAQLNVLDYLDASTAGGGAIEYSGSPKVDQRTAGAGRIYQK